jgi:anti-sigma factor RsiW
MKAAAPLSCQELVELVTEYLEGALPGPQRLAFEQHVAICPPCRGYFAQLRKTIRVGERLREQDLPPHVRDALLASFRNWKREWGEGREN